MRLNPLVDKPRESFHGVTFSRPSAKMAALWARNKIGSRLPKLVEWKYSNSAERIERFPSQLMELLTSFTFKENTMPIEDFVDTLSTGWNPMRVGKGNFDPFNFANRVYYYYLYSLVRKLKPKAAVEAGVYLGGSSAAILKAMQENDEGRLISLDSSRIVPDGLWKQRGIPIGYAVPEQLRSRWELVIGDSRDVLPTLLTRLGSIGLYLHDSDHTYQTVAFETETAWRHLSKGGVLVIDDCNLSLATYDFAKRNLLRPWLMSRDGVYPETLATFLK